MLLFGGAFRHEGGGDGVGAGGDTPCWVLLLPRLWYQGLEVKKDVSGGWLSAAGLARGLRLRSDFPAGLSCALVAGSGGCFAVGLDAGWVFFVFFWNTQFTDQRSADKEGQPIIQICDPHPKSWVSGSAGGLAYRRSTEG